MQLILKDQIKLIDVRAPIEFKEGALPYSINLPILLDDEREIRTILEWIGFNAALQRGRISNESFQDYIDIQSLKEKGITEISDSFQMRRPAAQRMVFGQHRIKKLKVMIHWCKYFRRVNAKPSINVLDQAQFITDLDTVSRRKEIRNV